MTADKTAAPDLGTPITMTYRNYRGEVDQRTVVPSRIWFGSTDWHPEPGWLMSAYDLGKAAHRDFALADCQFADLCASGHWVRASDYDALSERCRRLTAVVEEIASRQTLSGHDGDLDWLIDDARAALTSGGRG